MNAALQRPDWFASINSWFKRRILRDQRERWNHQYNEGRWEKLKSPLEMARLDVCAAQLRRQAETAPKSVLEIGCGEALLQQRTSRSLYTRWLGVDLSDVAITAARAHAGDNASYVVGDMTWFTPTDTFDVIIFPESIYYVEERAALLKRYAQFLNPNGVFIISIFETKRSAAVWKEIHTAAYPIYSDVTVNEIGSWYCETLKPKML